MRRKVQPSITGISTSDKMMSGGRLSAAAIATKPFSATRTRKPRSRSASPSSIRTPTESSTSKRLIGPAASPSSLGFSGSLEIAPLTQRSSASVCSVLKAAS